MFLFYELLSASAKSDGWVLPELKLLAEMADFKNDLYYDNTDYMRYVRDFKNAILEQIKAVFIETFKEQLTFRKKSRNS